MYGKIELKQNLIASCIVLKYKRIMKRDNYINFKCNKSIFVFKYETVLTIRAWPNEEHITGECTAIFLPTP